MRGIFFMTLLITLPLHGEVRDFSRELTQPEKEGITYLISTLSSHSIVSLGFYIKRLEQAGAKTERVHPLKFFEQVLTTPKLKKSIKRIKGVAWNKFTSGMFNNFQNAAGRDNLTPDMITQFAKETGVNEDTITAELKGHKWKAFMNTVRSAQ